jgi:hypothetical protein
VQKREGANERYRKERRCTRTISTKSILIEDYIERRWFKTLLKV